MNKNNKFFEEMFVKGFLDKIHNLKLISDNEHKNCINGYDKIYKNKDTGIDKQLKEII
ncbi:hypothetical protein [Desulfosporosinus sp.]|uniref:hypothetical protein n=1 Tax=Desulfosporosinus sp. TaxID=157907 RepID=UPI002622A8A5|nr:hypothetical protein [Desulfosporosinus sp.]